MGRETRQALVTSVILAAVLLASVYALGVVAGSQHTPSIQSATIEGEGVLDSDGNATTLWNDGSYALSVSVESHENPYELCASAIAPDRSRCRYVRLDNGTQTVTMTDLPWDGNTTGRHTLNVTIGSAGSSQVHDFVEHEVRLLDPDGDPDDDGLANREEVRLGTNMTLQDTDRDGLDDGAEVTNYGTDPMTTDSDEDGLTDAREINGRTDPTESDTDGDELADGREVNEVGTDPTEPDTDGDGVTDGPEVEIHETNPIDPDTDGDRIPDGQEVDDPDGDPLDPDAPGDALTEEVPGILPGPIGDYLLVLVFLALGGAGAATGVSVVRGGGLHAILPFVSRDESETADESVAHEAPTDDAVTTPGSNGHASPPETPSTPILTDEERVLRMLHENGGQIKQKRIVAETDWSKSKVSRLLSRMAEDGQIRKITLGRENVIRIPDENDLDSSAADRAGRDRS